ncbi:50S ribosomal protein L31 [Patescibacteria group bacterium]|nr:50S ribosomal protein L31 [Patescibacteria group bacterium]
MKASTHPTYYPSAKVTCACGHVFSVGSTKEEIHVELCNKCHPFYTGQQKLLDTSRRIEKYTEKKAKQAGAATTGKKVKSEKRAAQKEAKKTAQVEA